MYRCHARSISAAPSTRPRPTRESAEPVLAPAPVTFCSEPSPCAQITCQMVAAAMGIPTERIEVTVEGDLDLRGTLGISKDVPSALKIFAFILMSLRLMQPPNSCADCERKQNSIAS